MKGCTECASCLVLIFLIIIGLLNLIGISISGKSILCSLAIIIAVIFGLSAIHKAKNKKIMTEAKEILHKINKDTTNWPFCPMVTLIEPKTDRAVIVQVCGNYRQFALLTYVYKEKYAVHQVFNFSELRKWKSFVVKKLTRENNQDIKKIKKIAVILTLSTQGEQLTREICIYNSIEIDTATASDYLTQLKELQSLFSTIKPEYK